MLQIQILQMLQNPPNAAEQSKMETNVPTHEDMCLYQDKSDLPVKKRSFFNQRPDSTLLNKIPWVMCWLYL